MTTLAYDGRYIVCDGRESMGSTITNDSYNKFYIKNEMIFTLCGRVDDCKRFVNEFSEGVLCTNKDSDSGGFLFDGKNISLVFICEDKKVYVKNDISCGFWADGSGRDWAIAAMDHGKTAIDAVKYAISRDTNSGGLIRCYDTKTKNFIKVKQ